MSVALRAALAAVEAAVPETAELEQRVIAAKVRGLMVGYDHRWAGAEWRLEGEAERVVRLPIINPMTGRPSRTFTQAGKFDGLVRGYGKRLLLEHKSTSDDVGDPASPYFRRLAIDAQVSKYMLLAWQEGERVDGTLYDVIRKPGIRPKKLTKSELAELSSRGRYYGAEVPEPVYMAVMRGQEGECPTLYAMRLASETITEPDRYYQRRSVPRLDGEILEYAEESWAIADEIRLARVAGRHFRNSSACMEYGRPCTYLPLCAGEDTPESDRWQTVKDVHSELPAVADGRDVLTHSRIQCFQTCRRKHFYRYEQGLRRVNEDDGEALFLGTVLHLALAAWWTNQGEGHDGIERSAASAVAEQSTAG